jgi:hypothetical protein
MKIYKCDLIFSMLLVLSCAGCMAQETKKEDRAPIIVAIENSFEFARKDGVDLSTYSVVSAERNVNGFASVFDRNSKDPYDVSVVQKLQGKEYWEICYSAIAPGLVGATYCYYLDKTDYRLLSAYRMK